MSPEYVPIPRCECGFYNRDRHHGRVGGGKCPYYERRTMEDKVGLISLPKEVVEGDTINDGG